MLGKLSQCGAERQMWLERVIYKYGSQKLTIDEFYGVYGMIKIEFSPQRNHKLVYYSLSDVVRCFIDLERMIFKIPTQKKKSLLHATKLLT